VAAAAEAEVARARRRRRRRRLISSCKTLLIIVAAASTHSEQYRFDSMEDEFLCTYLITATQRESLVSSVLSPLSTPP
jgi:hypothetical protein